MRIRPIRTLRFFLLCAAALFMLAACREKTPYTVAGVALPDLADAPGTFASAPPTSQGITDTLTFKPASLALYEEYVAWLTKNGWSRLAENQDVTMVSSAMVKDSTQLDVTYSGSSGLTITGTKKKPATGAVRNE